MIHTAKWLNLEKMLNEKKTDTNATYCVILLNEVPRKGRFVETESKIVLTRDPEDGEIGDMILKSTK